MLKSLWFTVLILLISQVPTSVSAEPNSARQAQLQYLLVQDCGSCHGMRLKGGLGPALLPEALRDKPDEILVSTILNGRPGTPMPPWRELLTEDEARWLVSVLRSGGKP